MKLKFTKMHGCGNDYIFINCLGFEIPDPENAAQYLSNRHFGVGGDGIVLLLPSLTADAKMRIFNADGSEAGMCGNAIRCAGKYLYDNKITDTKTVTIETASGIKTVTLIQNDKKNGLAKVCMGRIELDPKKIPVAVDAEKIINYPVRINNKDYKITCLSVGNPHAVVFCKNTDKVDIAKNGPLFEKNKLFPERINTEFVQILSDHRLRFRVWERGSGETLSCGTGACAAAVAAILNGHIKENRDITVESKGGELVVGYKNGEIFLTGPCAKVFDGVLEY